jgi:hypothetical protein
MSPLVRPVVAGALALAMICSLGCSASYRYLRDPDSQIEERRSTFVSEHPGSAFNADILDGRVRIGMSRTEVVAAWGDPDEVRAARTAGIDVVYAYREDEPSRGESTFLLQFAGDFLQRVEVSRARVQVEHKAERPEADSPLEPFGNGKSLR